MARTGSIAAGGSLTPFGTGGVDFGVFDIANTKSASAQETASLAWAVARAQYDAGQIDDAAYMAAQQAYYAALDPSTQGYATGQYQIAQTQYSISRDQIAQQVQMGQAPPSALVEFDKQALGQVTPGSAEYRQRYDRLMSSEGMAFQYDESKMQADLDKGYLTPQQAQDWYKAQAEVYTENFAVSQDISNKIGQLQGAIETKADQAMVEAFNNGTLTIGQVLSYVAKVQAADPNSTRARNLGEVAIQAKDKTITASLERRYALTREYQQLQAFVKSSPSTTTTYSTTHEVRTYIGADGQLKTAVVPVTKAHAPSKSEQAAAAERRLQVAQAQERMKQIEAEVGTDPGGWVRADDMIRALKQSQAKLTPGTTGWYEVQKAIDGYESDKAAAELQAQLGIKITFPKVGSELVKGLTVGPNERPMGWSSAMAAKGKAYADRIIAYQAELDAGTADDARAATLQAAITKNYGYLSKLAGQAGTPPPVSVAPAHVAARASGGGGGSSPTATTGKTPSGLPVSGALPAVAQGPFAVWSGQTAITVSPKGTTTRLVTSPAGWPTGMSGTALEDLYSHAVDAYKSGSATFTYGGTSYAIPTDPKSRVNFIAQLDAANIAVQRSQYEAQVLNAQRNGVTASEKHSIETRESAYWQAVAQSQQNKLSILTSPTPGAMRDEKGKVVRITDYPVNPVNTLGFAADIKSTAEVYAADQLKQAQAYFDAGDFTAAYRSLGLAQARLQSAAGAVATWTAKAQAFVNQTVGGAGASGVQVQVPTDVAKALTDLGAPGADYRKMFPDLFAEGEKLTKTLVGPDGNGGVLKAVNGIPVPTSDPLRPNDPSLVTLKINDGVVLHVNAAGKLEPVRQTAAGKAPDGSSLMKGGNEVTVKVRTLNGFVDAVADYQIVPSMFAVTVNGQTLNLNGKAISVNGQTWYENPIMPGQWLPDAPGQLVRINLPPDAKVVTMPGNTGTGIAKGTTTIAWQQGGETYSLVDDGEGGTYNLYGTAVDGTPVLIGPAATPTGAPAQNVLNILGGAGVRLDTGTLSSQQSSFMRAVNNQPSGAWIGATADQISSWLHPSPGRPTISTPKVSAAGFVVGTQAIPTPPPPSSLAPAYQLGVAPSSEGAAIRTQALGGGGAAVPGGGQQVAGAGMYLGSQASYGVGPSYTPGPTYTPQPYYGTSSYYQTAPGAPVVSGKGTVAYVPKTVTTYGEGSAITAKPLPTTTPPKTPTLAVAPPPRPNLGGAAARGK